MNLYIITNMQYLGIDWGFKRIGLAISEGEIASPFKTIEVNSLKEAVGKIVDAIRTNNINQVVIGKPEGEMGKAVDNATRLLKNSGVAIIQTDETLSTQEAKKLMVKMGKGKKKRRDENAVAAALILQNFLDQRK